MDLLSLFLKLLISFALGAVVGLERQVGHRPDETLAEKKMPSVLGVRTFSLIAVLGTLTGFLMQDFSSLALIIASGFFLLVVAFYVLYAWSQKDIGITTEIAIIITFLLGFFIAVQLLPIQIIVAATVLLTLILSRKEKIKDMVGRISRTEINSLISFLIISLVILPFLPNTSFSIADIPEVRQIITQFGLNVDRIANMELINPFRLWLIVALITGIELVGYVLERTLGKTKGWLLASIAGGFVSSTATTISLAQQSKEEKRINHLLSAAIFSNMASFFQIAIVILPLSIFFFAEAIPVFIGLIISSALVGIYFLKAKDDAVEHTHTVKEEAEKSIFNISTALKFAGLYLVISIFSKVALAFLGQTGFLIASGIGAVAGLDAVLINAAVLVGSNITAELAVFTLILANAVNLLAKTIYCFLYGKKEFAVKFFISVLLIIASSFVYILF